MNYAKPQWRNSQPYSQEYEDVYYSLDNGIEETEFVFIQHNHLVKRFSQLSSRQFVIGETGFGSGLNFLMAATHWLTLSQENQVLHYYSVEKNPFTPQDLVKAQSCWPELANIAKQLQQQYQLASTGFHSFNLFNGRIKLVLMIGDAELMLSQMQGQVDAWFLDGFAPGCNPEMWSEGVFSQIKRLSKPKTSFSTYTAAGVVRRGLAEVGFDVKKVEGTGNKRHMLMGQFKADIPSHVSQKPWYEASHKSPKANTICIIGAGIAGLTTAYALVKRGFKVDILEAGDAPGFQGSGNPRGMLMPRLSLQDSADAEFYNAAYFYTQRCLQQLDVHQNSWQQTGGLQLASSERIKKQIANYPQDELLARVLDGETASQLSGLSINKDEKVHYFPKAACVYPKKILAKLIEAMGESLKIHYNLQVDSLEYSQQQSTWHLKNKQGEQLFTADCLILASAWQSKLFKQCDHLLLQPARGQVSLFRANSNSQKLKMPISYEGYLLPEHNGEHIAGASFKVDDCDNGLTAEEHQQNFEHVNQWFSGLFSSNDITGGRASVRAVSCDRMPIVGRAPDAQQYAADYGDLYKGKPAAKYPIGSYHSGLYLNTGHGARGFCSAFLSAEILVAGICNEPLPVSSRVSYSLHAARFLIRSLKKRKAR